MYSDPYSRSRRCSEAVSSFFLLRAPFGQYGPVAATWALSVYRSRLAPWTRGENHGKLSALRPLGHGRYRFLASGPRADSLLWFDSPLVQGASRPRYTDKAQMQRPGHTGRKALAKKKKWPILKESKKVHAWQTLRPLSTRIKRGELREQAPTWNILHSLPQQSVWSLRSMTKPLIKKHFQSRRENGHWSRSKRSQGHSRFSLRDIGTLLPI